MPANRFADTTKVSQVFLYVHLHVTVTQLSDLHVDPADLHVDPADLHVDLQAADLHVDCLKIRPLFFFSLDYI